MTRYKIVRHMERNIDFNNNIEVETRYYVKESIFFFLWGYIFDCNNRYIWFSSKKDAEKFLIKYRDAYVGVSE